MKNSSKKVINFVMEPDAKWSSEAPRSKPWLDSLNIAVMTEVKLASLYIFGIHRWKLNLNSSGRMNFSIWKEIPYNSIGSKTVSGFRSGYHCPRANVFIHIVKTSAVFHTQYMVAHRNTDPSVTEVLSLHNTIEYIWKRILEEYTRKLIALKFFTMKNCY